ncbi:hypothetical protein XU18_1698 [Perkinsela sp. CCAP 1560/4]|nr:hypothetical protein XU18_1698 [Perkinsela sp. CCAP 1560/4]|eukprot:KNH07604.1 hypothetical protein XU18_1698 [Perkinsela sp. CCAP 1560/4]
MPTVHIAIYSKFHFNFTPMEIDMQKLIGQVMSIEINHIVQQCPQPFLHIFIAIVLYRVASIAIPRVLFLITCIPLLVLMLVLSVCFEHLAFLRFISKHTSQSCCTFLWCFLMRVWIFFNPQIKVKNQAEEARDISKDIPNGSIILVNHTSYFDAPMAVSTMAFSAMPRIRTCYKASLKYIPIFGNIPKYCGHFPVYFTKDADNDFSVDRKRQNEVNNEINSLLLEKKGILMIFPEGQLSKNAKQLQPFRHGSFAMALQHKPKIYALLHYETNRTWPRGYSLGGLGATIQYELIQLDVNYNDKNGVCTSASTLSDHCQAMMQKRLDRLSSKK